MRADFKAHELEKAFALVCKALRRKKAQAQDRAKALMVLGDKGICVKFNRLIANCPAEVSEGGKYAVNPFIFRPFLETFGKTKITMEINREGITIGHLYFEHIRVHGRFDHPEEAIESWESFRGRQLSNQRRRL